MQTVQGHYKIKTFPSYSGYSLTDSETKYRLLILQLPFWKKKKKKRKKKWIYILNFPKLYISHVK